MLRLIIIRREILYIHPYAIWSWWVLSNGFSRCMLVTWEFCSEFYPERILYFHSHLFKKTEGFVCGAKYVREYKDKHSSEECLTQYPFWQMCYEEKNRSVKLDQHLEGGYELHANITMKSWYPEIFSFVKYRKGYHR